MPEAVKKLIAETQTFEVKGTIANALKRISDNGVYVGPPVGNAYVDNDKTIERQHFLYAYAVRRLAEDNVNLTVFFCDARGAFASESGLDIGN